MYLGYVADTPLLRSLFADKQIFRSTPGLQLALRIEKELQENFISTLVPNQPLPHSSKS